MQRFKNIGLFGAIVAFTIGFMLLMAPACRTPKTTSTQHSVKKDSVHVEVREVLRKDTIRIPADSAAIMALVKCPDGTTPLLVYVHDTVPGIINQSKSGHTGLSLSLMNGVLKAQANCHELEYEVYVKDYYIKYWQSAYQSWEKQEHTVYTKIIYPWWWWLCLVFTLVFIIIKTAKTFFKSYIPKPILKAIQWLS